MGLSDLLAKLLELLGLKKSETRKYDEMEQELRANKASNVDRLESLKEQIAVVERQARAKKKEYDAATGDTKRIVGGEIERIFAELDGLRGREVIIGRNLETLSKTIAKVNELKAAIDQGVDEDTSDGLTVNLEDMVAELKSADRAVKGMVDVRYEAPKSERIDVDARMADLEGQSEPADGISQSTLDRLKQLESEE